MKFTVNTKEFSDAVMNLQRAVSSKTSIPALEGILIKTDVGSIELTAYDLEMGMQTKLLANVSEQGEVILPAKLFSDIVKKAPADLVSVTTDDKNIATLESGDSSFTIIGINAEEFPELPSVGNAEPITLEADILKSMIRQTIFAVAESDAKPVHQGSLFNISGGVLEVVSVDGFRLALRKENVNVTKSISFVVPGKTLSEVIKLVKDGNVDIFPGKRHIMFRIDNYTVISGILEGEFLDYKAAIPKQSSAELTLRTRDFIESTERVSLIISDRLKSPVRCVFEEGGVKLSCTTSIGRAFDRFPAELKGNGFEMGFNNKYLLDALKNAECDEITLKLGGPLSPMIMTPKGSDSFLFLVLPVRLKSE
ncbi:MAG: DNA polymerase III subunit beta [Clostridia bacterium]|nr:DNA polymerase III subunit beta [Clostridia bacterium]